MATMEHEDHVHQLTATAKELVSFVGGWNRAFADELSSRVRELRSLLGDSEGDGP